jgi:UDP-N-acetylglucosamine:LPS N-acetylglucosamine transferase
MKTTKKKVLFVSGSIGLGHVTRDLSIAVELRRQNPNIELSWLAAPPASSIIKNAGETLLPENDLYANDNVPAEQSAVHSGLNLLKYLFKARKDWRRNAEIFKEVTSRKHFDLIIGDETYEVLVALLDKRIVLEVPFVIIYDFLGLDAMSDNIIERLGTYFWNWKWSQDYKVITSGKNIALFVGELEDIQDKKFGVFMPNRREHAKTYYHFIGYILQFNPADYVDRLKIRSMLGYGPEPLVVCSIGGTAIGKDLLELCGQAYPIIRKKIPDLRMVLVCGPRLSADSLDIPPGPDVKQYVPNLYQHYASCDLAIVQGGGTATLELTALRRPFLYFPLEGHCEQELTVASRLTRHRAGVRMSYTNTTPDFLAQAVISNLGKEVDYITIPAAGASNAARLINLRL